jgi:hypothetical protein
MRTIKALLAAAVVACPLAMNVAAARADEDVTRTRIVHHVRWHHYAPRIHYGYYWYQWGWRKGGTARSWVGSSFSWVNPYVWGPAPTWWW